MKREELDRLAELRAKCCGPNPCTGAALAAWDSAIFAAAPPYSPPRTGPRSTKPNSLACTPNWSG